MLGETLSHFSILERLGSGGFGEVFRARDTRLGRDVAIKLLPAGALADDAARKGFHKEAVTLSRLNHPNIATIYEFGSEGGVDFLVMELVPQPVGVPLPEAEVARLGAQLADGLAAAHRAGILHRDIKPANLRVTSEGRLKILDFGLAKVTHAAAGVTTRTVTQTGRIAGTLPYMSPEQFRGKPFDERSDIHAVGAVLYEVASGRRAFPQESEAAIIEAILKRKPPTPRKVAPALSPDFERIIMRCLEKDPADRYTNADELHDDLRQLAIPEEERHLHTKLRRPHRWIKAGGLAAALVLVALLTVPQAIERIREGTFGPGLPPSQALAVLPLANISNDSEQEYFADGMTDELITCLGQVGALRVTSRSAVMQYKGTRKPLRRIAKELHVRSIVEGSILKVGEKVRINAKLVEAESDRVLWSERYEQPVSNVIALQNEIAQAIVRGVQARMTPAERGRLTVRATSNSGAHDAYLKGRFYANRYNPRAVEFYNRALELDPDYAPAWAGLADYYASLSSPVMAPKDAMPRARAAATKALEIDSLLPAAHASLAYVEAFYDWNWKRAEEGLKKAIAVNPSEPTAHQNYGFLLVVNRRFPEAEREFGRAAQIDPLSPVIRFMSLWPLFESRRYDEALKAASELIAASPDFDLPRLILGQTHLMKGDTQRGIDALKVFRPKDANPVLAAWLGYAYGRAGQRAQAIDVLKTIQARSAKEYVQPYCYVILHLGLGEKERAMDYLIQAVDQRTDEALFLNVDPVLDPLRSDPRFPKLVQKLGLSS